MTVNELLSQLEAVKQSLTVFDGDATVLTEDGVLSAVVVGATGEDGKTPRLVLRSHKR